MALWKKRTRDEMLAWFATLDEETLERVWCGARDRNAPETYEENFICRGCRHWVPGIECEAPASMGIKSYKDCEVAVAQSSLAWLSRMKDPFVEEGVSAFLDGSDKSDCPYAEGSDGQSGWLRGWNEAEELDHNEDRP